MEVKTEIKNKAVNKINADLNPKETFELKKDTKNKGRYGLKKGAKVALTPEMAKIYKSKGLI